MRRTKKSDATPGEGSPDPGTSSKRNTATRSGKKVQADKNLTPSGSKNRRRIEKKARIRETDEARALLENQLHGLYWWVFNAFRIRGFIRAKELDEMALAKSEEQALENSGLGDADTSPRS
jgi:hypothetical protein